MAAVAGQAPIAPPEEGGGGGAGGGQSAQLLQQITQLLTQLAQEQSDPQVQEAVKGMMDQATQLEGVVGQNDVAAMQGGLHNPGGEEEPLAEPGGGAAPGGDVGQSEIGGGDSGGDHGGAEIHVKIAPPKSFSGAKKAAMSTFGEKGHFDPKGEKGKAPTTQKSKNKAKG